MPTSDKHRYCDVMKALAHIALENRNGAQHGDALKFQKLLQTFEFVLILVLLIKVLSSINAASVYLKRRLDELAEDTRLTNAEQRFRITVFNCVTDMATSQLTQRFTAVN